MLVKIKYLGESLIIISIISELIPFGCTIFLLRTQDFLFVSFIELVCFVAFVILQITIFLLFKKDKIYYVNFIIAVLLAAIYFVFYGKQLEIANWVYFKMHDTELIELHAAFNSLDGLKELSVSRNGENITINHKVVENEKTIIDSLNLDYSKYQNLKKIMKDCDVFIVEREKSIVYITNGGFIDSESGYAFSIENIKPTFNHAGKILNWQNVGKDWYYWFAD